MFKSLKDRFMGQNAPSKGGKKGAGSTAASKSIENGREYKLVGFFFLDVVFSVY